MPGRASESAASARTEPGSRQGGSRTRITVETEIPVQDAADFYGLYAAAFEPLRPSAVARQVLYEREFFEEMADPRVLKYVAWDPHDRPIGLSTLTRHLETIPWISPQYFTAHFPEHAARRAIYYLGFTLVHASTRRSRVFAEMIGAIVRRLVAERAVCAYDICSYNNRVLRLAGNIEALLHRTADVSVEVVDSQAYYAATFGGPSSDGPVMRK
jgi:hypothetical protein